MLQEISPCREGYNYHWGTLYKGAVTLRSDSPVNLSEEMYREFCMPYDEKISAAFGSVAIHFCGRADHWVKTMLETKGLRGINFGRVPGLVYGESHMREIYPTLKERSIAVMQYQATPEELSEMTAAGYVKGITFEKI